MPRKNPKPQEEAPGFEEIQGPAIITPLHIQTRETSTVAGAPRAWRKMSQLEACYRQERLGTLRSKEAIDRLNSGIQYTKLWDLSHKGSRDSTAGFDAAGGMGSGLPLTETQAEANRRLAAIDGHLGRKDLTILRSVLGRGNTPAEAIALAGISKEQRVTPRFCEALDALQDALDRTAKSRDPR